MIRKLPLTQREYRQIQRRIDIVEIGLPVTKAIIYIGVALLVFIFINSLAFILRDFPLSAYNALFLIAFGSVGNIGIQLTLGKNYPAKHNFSDLDVHELEELKALREKYSNVDNYFKSLKRQNRSPTVYDYEVIKNMEEYELSIQKDRERKTLERQLMS